MSVEIESTLIPDWNDTHAAGVEFRVWCDDSFTDADGFLHFGGDFDSVVVHRSACTVNTTARTLTIPIVNLPATTDALDRQTRRYYAAIVWVSGSSVTKLQDFSLLPNGFRVGPTPATTTWPDLIDFNVYFTPNVDNSAWPKDVSDRRYLLLNDADTIGDASTNTSVSVDSQVALFSGTLGKTLKRASGTGIPKLTSGVLSIATAGTDYPGLASANTFSGTNIFTLSVIGPLYDKNGATNNAKAYGAFGDGNSHPLSGIYASLAAAQVDYPLAQSLSDEIDTVAIEQAYNAATDAAQAVVPPGRYRISRELKIGDGTSGGRSTKNRFVSLLGSGFGFSSDETLPEGGATEFYWYGPAGGTMISVNGPIGGIRIEGIYAHLKPGANGANTFLALHHVNNSTFKRLLATHYSGTAYIIDAYPDGANGSTADGADDNKWEQVFADHAETGGGKGIQIGSASVAGGILNVARNTWDRCYFEGDMELRYADSSTFIDSTAGTLKVIPPAGNNGFPSAICFVNSPMAVDDTSGGAWGNSNPLFFWPHPTGDITSIPNATWALGVTYTGKFFGSGWAFTGTVPSLAFTDTTASAKSLTIAVDANKADFRESAGAAGSLLSLDLANVRVGIGTNAPSRLLHLKASTLPGFELEISGAQRWFFYAGAGTASGAGFSVFDDTQVLDRLAIDAVTGNIIALQKLGVGLAINATPASQLEALVSDNGTTNVPTIATFGHDSSGTPATNYGGLLAFNLKDSTTTGQQAANFQWYFPSTPTHGSASSAVKVQTLNAGALASPAIFDYTNGNQFAAALGSTSTRVLGASPGGLRTTMSYSLSGFNGVAGDGPSFLFNAPNAAGTGSILARISGALETATAGSEAGYISFATRSASDTTASFERWRIDSSGRLLSSGLTVANLGTPANGTFLYCSDAKNSVDNGVAVGSVVASGGNGAFVARINGSWRTMC